MGWYGCPDPRKDARRRESRREHRHSRMTNGVVDPRSAGRPSQPFYVPDVEAQTVEADDSLAG